MSDTILSIENVSKQYQLGTFGTGTIGRDVDRWFRTKIMGKEDPYLKIGQTNDRTSKEKADFVWALRDINFEVKRGEVLGIIGKNGAGKSTLLKLLSRVTGPTTGAIRSAGRMASLLEVGTGFHPELTGLENIYLNGAILGMTKAEIKRKLDEIIDFSGCALYIDTPVKRYSSGMTVRLGFAVAAFLDPEILVVDEVLAVGDFEFQNKAIGKMQEVSKEEGRTVLFVSHNLNSIERLCKRGILLENGLSVMDDNIHNVLRSYRNSGNMDSQCVIEYDEENAPGNNFAKLKSVRILDEHKNLVTTIKHTKKIFVEVVYWDYNKDHNNTAILQFKNDDDVILFATNEFSNPEWESFHKQGRLISTTCEIPANTFNVGRINVLVAVGNYNPNMVHVIKDNAVGFNIVLDEANEVFKGQWPGLVRPSLKWTIC